MAEFDDILLAKRERKTKLQKILDKKGMTQRELSVLANTEKYQINKLCKGKLPNIHLDTARRICKALGVTLNDVFEED